MEHMNFHHQAVTDTPGEHALFMVFTLKAGEDAESAAKDLASSFSALIRSMKNRYPEAIVSGVMGFGYQAWKRLFPDLGLPHELENFKEIKGDRFTAPATPGDLFFHLRAKRKDCIMEIAANIISALGDAVHCEDEVQGFRNFDGRTIFGFVDGTENPEYDKGNFAIIGDEDPAFKGGSYAVVQKYLHDMKVWNQMTTEHQERTIGRRKYDDVEISEEDKAENAHNVVTNISGPNGEELKIVRANMPFSNPAKNEFGTYFIGYARYYSTTRRMLENMIIGEPRGNTDLLMEFSTIVTGSLFYIPTFDFLDEVE